MKKTRNRTADRFAILCKNCKHFHCVTNRDGQKWCTAKGRLVGKGNTCSKYIERQYEIYFPE